MRVSGNNTSQFAMLWSSEYGKYLLGILCKLIPLSCFCILSLDLEKGALARNIAPVPQFGIMCVIGALVLVPFVLLFWRSELKTANLKLYPIRALGSILGMVTWIEAVRRLGSTQSTLVLYLVPIVALLLAAVTRTEVIKVKCLLVGLLCYVVITVTMSAEINSAGFGFLMAMLSTCCWGVYEVMCSRQAATEHYIVQVFLTFTFAAIFLLPFCYIELSGLSLSEWKFQALLSFVRIANVVFLFLAIKLATLNWLAPVSYIKLPIIAFWSYVLHGTIVEHKYFIASIVLSLLTMITIRLKRREAERRPTEEIPHLPSVTE